MPSKLPVKWFWCFRSLETYSVVSESLPESALSVDWNAKSVWGVGLDAWLVRSILKVVYCLLSDYAREGSYGSRGIRVVRLQLCKRKLNLPSGRACSIARYFGTHRTLSPCQFIDLRVAVVSCWPFESRWQMAPSIERKNNALKDWTSRKNRTAKNAKRATYI